MKIAAFVPLFVATSLAVAQAPFPYPIALNPGEYQIKNQADILKQQVDLTVGLQGQDAAEYRRITVESYQAYQALYGTCNAAQRKCTSFQELRRIKMITMDAKTVPGVDVAEINNAIMEYRANRDLLLQKLAAVEVTKQVWDSVIDSNIQDNIKQQYRRGALNYNALAEAYRTAISEMDRQANAFQYKYKDGRGVSTTLRGAGLEFPDAAVTPEVMQAELQELKKNITFSPPEGNFVKAMHLNMVNQMVNFTDSTGRKLIWFTKEQINNNQGWIKDVENEARLHMWTRANFCMPLGVPGVDIPREGVISQFSVFLNRGLTENHFRLTQSVVSSLNDLREMKSRLERIFVHLQSQNGEFNNVGGVMGYVHRVNSTFTWHNQVTANVNIMRILRDMINDEIDILQADISGCERVRARYNARYGSIKDPSFVSGPINRYYRGVIAGGASDPLLQSFNKAGAAILARGVAYNKVQAYEKEHPSVLLGDDLFGDGVK